MLRHEHIVQWKHSRLVQEALREILHARNVSCYEVGYNEKWRRRVYDAFLSPLKY